jgi:serine/threonine protein kinase
MRTETLDFVPVSRSPHPAPVDWNSRVETLARGACSERDFFAELWLHVATAPGLPWEVVALLDQHYRRGILPADIFRSVAAKITRRQLTAESMVPVALRSAQQPLAQTVPTPLDGYPFPSKQLAIGDVLRDRYVIDSCLGSGGMGTVYKAVDKFRQEHGEIDCHVAIKVLHEGTRERPAALARLRCEFYCAQMLSHPNVINVFDLDRGGDLDFFTMEWLDGELLSSVLQQFAGRPMPRIAAWAIIRQVAEGIERNIVHADLKPQNIMLLKSGQVRILDFGASSSGPRGAEADRPARNQLALTPAYASCELLTGKAPDPRDDLYALSCLACELLAGQHPFWHQRSTAARMAQSMPSRPPSLSDRQWRVLMQGLAWDREHRSISVRDWLAVLNPQAVSLHCIPRPQQLDATTGPPAAPALTAARIMAALGVFLACLSAWALFNRPAPMGMTAAAMATASASKSTAPADDAAPSATAETESSDASGKLASDEHHATSTVSSRHVSRAIGLASASYRVPVGANFAEVRVLRTSASDGSSFEWWTEESTARSGVDYVPQQPAKVTFQHGSRMATLFVKLLGDSGRKQSAKFEVVIGGASKGTSVGSAADGVIDARCSLPDGLGARHRRGAGNSDQLKIRGVKAPIGNRAAGRCRRLSNPPPCLRYC